MRQLPNSLFPLSDRQLVFRLRQFHVSIMDELTRVIGVCWIGPRLGWSGWASLDEVFAVPSQTLSAFLEVYPSRRHAGFFQHHWHRSGTTTFRDGAETRCTGPLRCCHSPRPISSKASLAPTTLGGEY